MPTAVTQENEIGFLLDIEGAEKARKQIDEIVARLKKLNAEREKIKKSKDFQLAAAGDEKAATRIRVATAGLQKQSTQYLNQWKKTAKSLSVLYPGMVEDVTKASTQIGGEFKAMFTEMDGFGDVSDYAKEFGAVAVAETKKVLTVTDQLVALQEALQDAGERTGDALLTKQQALGKEIQEQSTQLKTLDSLYTQLGENQLEELDKTIALRTKLSSELEKNRNEYAEIAAERMKMGGEGAGLEEVRDKLNKEIDEKQIQLERLYNALSSAGDPRTYEILSKQAKTARNDIKDLEEQIGQVTLALENTPEYLDVFGNPRDVLSGAKDILDYLERQKDSSASLADVQDTISEKLSEQRNLYKRLGDELRQASSPEVMEKIRDQMSQIERASKETQEAWVSITKLGISQQIEKIPQFGNLLSRLATVGGEDTDKKIENFGRKVDQMMRALTQLPLFGRRGADEATLTGFQKQARLIVESLNDAAQAINDAQEAASTFRQGFASVAKQMNDFSGRLGDFADNAADQGGLLAKAANAGSGALSGIAGVMVALGPILLGIQVVMMAIAAVQGFVQKAQEEGAKAAEKYVDKLKQEREQRNNVIRMAGEGDLSGLVNSYTDAVNRNAEAMGNWAAMTGEIQDLQSNIEGSIESAGMLAGLADRFGTDVNTWRGEIDELNRQIQENGRVWDQAQTEMALIASRFADAMENAARKAEREIQRLVQAGRFEDVLSAIENSIQQEQDFMAQRADLLREQENVQADIANLQAQGVDEENAELQALRQRSAQITGDLFTTSQQMNLAAANIQTAVAALNGAMQAAQELGETDFNVSRFTAAREYQESVNDFLESAATEDAERITQRAEEDLQAARDLNNSLSEENERYTDSVRDATDKHLQDLEQMRVDFYKGEREAYEEYQKSLADLDKETQDNLAKTQEEYDDQREESQEQHQREMRKAEEEFARQRLRAQEDLQDQLFEAEMNNDVLGFLQAQMSADKEAKRAQEDFDLSQKENQEQFDLEQQKSQEEHEAQLKEIQDQAVERRAEMETQFQEERAQAREQYEQQVEQSQQEFEESMEQERQNHAQALAQLVEQYQERQATEAESRAREDEALREQRATQFQQMQSDFEENESRETEMYNRRNLLREDYSNEYDEIMNTSYDNEADRLAALQTLYDQFNRDMSAIESDLFYIDPETGELVRRSNEELVSGAADAYSTINQSAVDSLNFTADQMATSHQQRVQLGAQYAQEELNAVEDNMSAQNQAYVDQWADIAATNESAQSERLSTLGEYWYGENSMLSDHSQEMADLTGQQYGDLETAQTDHNQAVTDAQAAADAAALEAQAAQYETVTGMTTEHNDTENAALEDHYESQDIMSRNAYGQMQNSFQSMLDRMKTSVTTTASQINTITTTMGQQQVSSTRAVHNQISAAIVAAARAALAQVQAMAGAAGRGGGAGGLNNNSGNNSGSGRGSGSGGGSGGLGQRNPAMMAARGALITEPTLVVAGEEGNEIILPVEKSPGLPSNNEDVNRVISDFAATSASLGRGTGAPAYRPSSPYAAAAANAGTTVNLNIGDVNVGSNITRAEVLSQFQSMQQTVVRVLDRHINS